MPIQNKTIVLTGASGGLGKALARELAKNNNRLILVGRNLEALNKVKSDIPHSDTHLVVCADINSEDGRQKIKLFCERLPQGIQVLINNAGVSNFSFLGTQISSEIESTLNTNLVSPILLTQKLLPLLRLQSTAKIVNIGSSFGSIGFPGFTAYCASKFGLRGFSEALRRELADTKITVNYIAPRAICTNINSTAVVALNKKLGNTMDRPELVAKIITNKLKDKKSKDIFIGYPENIFTIINGLFPTIVDTSLRKQLSTIYKYSLN